MRGILQGNAPYSWRWLFSRMPAGDKLLFIPDVSELILCADERYTCETYIFEPSTTETKLGRLYAVAETEHREGVGPELLDVVIQALQREYFRDPSRGVLASFESALHQANLVLHDTAEQGVRDWMGHFHVAVGVVANTTLHISCAGEAAVLLVRRGRVTLISEDLAYSPITNPLRTFSQVASGAITPRDALFFGTAALANLFRDEDLVRFAIEQSAETITTRLQQLYDDRRAHTPVATLVITLPPTDLPHTAPVRLMGNTPPERQRQRDLATPLTPRRPLIIHRSTLRAILALIARLLLTGWQWVKTHLWPTVIKSSRSGGRLLAQAGVATGRNVKAVTQRTLQRTPTTTATPSFATTLTPRGRFPALKTVPTIIRTGTTALLTRLRTLPRTSKIFAALAIVMAIALVASLGLLQSKRAADSEIQRASEILHDVRTKQSAAETALIYDNRDQAQQLLSEARQSIGELQALNLYQTEAAELEQSITALEDRLQKITRASLSTSTVVADVSSALGNATATSLALLDDIFYTFHPTTNTIISINPEGKVADITSTTEGIGFLKLAAPHAADKNITYVTDEPGVALFAAKEGTLTTQTVSLPSTNPNITAVAAFASRLYLYDKAAQNIFSYTKTLRGYSSATPWITSADVPRDNIVSLTVDGSIYTLHSDGTIRELYKGEPTDLKVEAVEPPLTTATKLITSDAVRHLYVLDPTNKRVVIFTKKGTLVRQLIFDSTALQDIVISPDEQTLYALDGTRILSLPLNLNPS